MNIQPSTGAASLAGTPRAQSQGTDSERRSPSADVHNDAQLNALGGIEAGTKSDDRDADGRQMLEHREPQHRKNAANPPDSAEPDDLQVAAERRPPTPDGSGTHIDYQA